MRSESDDLREKMKDHWAKTGGLDVEGVPAEMKRSFVREHLEAARREVDLAAAKLEDLMAQEADWERLAVQVGAVEDVAAEQRTFTKEERAWFKEGESEDHMALQESWEATGSLDVDDIPDEEKAAFAEKKLAQLRAAISAGHVKADETSDERLSRLEVLIAQYGKG